MVGDLPHEVLAVGIFLLQGAAGQVQQIGPGHELDIFVVRQIEMFLKLAPMLFSLSIRTCGVRSRLSRCR